MTKVTFWQQVDFSGECWEWKGKTNPNGYGRFWTGVSDGSVHRLSYLALVGEIPAGLQLHHECENKRCVNPDHLRACTPRENTQATLYKHRQLQKDVCAHGHPYDSLEKQRGRYVRRCSICKRRHKQEMRKRKIAV